MAKKRVRFYGRVKIKHRQKMCWISEQNKNGWSLGLALNTHTVWLRNVRFVDRQAVEKAMESGGIVFIHLKNSKDEICTSNSQQSRSARRRSK